MESLLYPVNAERQAGEQQGSSFKSEALRRKGCDTETKREETILQIREEICRRQHLGEESWNRRKLIVDNYIPMHPELFTLKEEYLSPEFLDIVSLCRTRTTTAKEVMNRLKHWERERVYILKVFRKEFCDQFLEELEHFEASNCPKGRPNTMNKYGILLNELGFDEDFITPFREKYLAPITSILYPDWGGSNLDSHKAFVVTYRLEEDVDLNYHYDNSEVTLNVALGKDFDGGTLYFGDMRTERNPLPGYHQYDHEPLYGVLHRGQHMHGAMPIDEGQRYNLIIWLRSSHVRNRKCPMCDRQPDLVEARGFADGFTKDDVDVVNVCSSV